MGDQTNIVLGILIGSFIIFILVLVIIMFVVTYNRKMMEKNNAHNISIKNKELEILRVVIETQESEREKIARNLHDEVGPLLTTLKLNISRYKRALDQNKLTIEMLNEERVFIDSIIDNVRTASHDLSPQFLLKYGIVKAIQNYISVIESPKVELITSLLEDVPENQVVINLYRLILEIVNNIIKHDSASVLKLILNQTKSQIVFNVAHDGVGISTEEFIQFAVNSKGLGMHSIQSRVVILNGTLDFYKQEADYQVQLVIPLSTKNEGN